MSYFPTLREIRDELIEAQRSQVSTKSIHWTKESTQIDLVRINYAENWQLLFELANLGDLDKPLTHKILSDPNHNVVKHILYLYSMQSFIYEELNRASREKDETKIPLYGAFAAALSYIIYHATSNRKDVDVRKSRKLYRGLKMSPYEIDNYVIGAKIHMCGYTSTSEDPNIALAFAFNELKDDFVPVLFEIDFKGKHGLFQLTNGFTAYEDEKEILIQDGLQYLVVGNKYVEQEDGVSYHCVQLRYPA